jgi:Mlc titration factor MtfA (ptsG expression regulator)
MNYRQQIRAAWRTELQRAPVIAHLPRRQRRRLARDGAAHFWTQRLVTPHE